MGEKYLAKKAVLFQYLEDAHSAIVEADKSADVATISKKFSAIEITFPDLIEQFDELNLLVYKKKGVPDQKEDYAKALDLYGEIKSISKKYSTSTSIEKPVPAKVKLPPIEIPEFNGNPTGWKIFKESFESLIISNSELSSTQKVQYLVTKLQGKATSICAGIDCTGDNFSLIWKALVARYDDPRSLATLYFNKLLSFQSRHSETPEKLTEFIDSFCSVIESLKSLKLENLEDFLLLNIALAKLPSETVKAFETSMMSSGKAIPAYLDLKNFVTTHIQMLQRCINTPSHRNEKPHNFSPAIHSKRELPKPKSFFVKEDKINNKTCVCCKQASHPLYRCEKFLQLSPHDRYNIVRDSKLCLNCLNSKHVIKNCSSQTLCSKCGKRHHTLLHFETYLKPSTEENRSENNTSSNHPEEKPTSHKVSNPIGNTNSGSKIFCSTTSSSNTQTVLLSTVKVKIVDKKQNAHIGRFLLDSGSQSNFITAEFCKQIGLHYGNLNNEINISGMGSLTTPVLGQIDNLKIESVHDASTSYNIDALVVKNVTDKLPTSQICSTQVQSLENLVLADDSFGVPGKIHGLIGGALYPYLMLPGQVKTTESGPVAMNTTLGYVVLGTARSCTDILTNNKFCGFIQKQSLDSMVQRFWEDEEITLTTPLLSDDELKAEDHFKATHQFDNIENRYVVKLPFKSDPSCLGLSYDIARNRFRALEKKLQRSPMLKEKYQTCVDDLIKSNILQKVNDETKDGYFVPHHMIVKEQSLTTKHRIVFDFSCKSSNGLSLNNIVYPGPKLYSDLFSILLNFRLFEFALVADVAKMFLQIVVHSDDIKYQKILWRSNPDQSLDVYALTRVTFGLSSSPFLAQRVIRQLAVDKEKEYPLVKEVIDSAFYMDDLTLSLPTTEKALEVQHQLIDCFKSAHFDLVKWSSNTPTLLDKIPPASCISSLTDWNPDNAMKILGMYWKNMSDQFSFGVTVEESVCTKRSVLSNLAKIWDPLGLISPVTVHCKILLQSLWSLNLQWDQPAPTEISHLWKQIIDELKLLSEIKVPRHISVVEGSKLSLIGYCDASLKACAAVAYSLVSIDGQPPIVTLLAAKSKVAPLKKISIPRLELNAALLLARLLCTISNQYASRYPVQEVIGLSDSTIALHWIKASPHKWQTYVANRVTKIQNIMPPGQWYHVSSENNPSADCLSRGLLPSQLLNHPTWFNGPAYLTEDRSTWPINLVGEPTTPLPESKNIVLVTVSPQKDFLLEMTKKYSSWIRILRILVFVYRFLKKLPIHSQISVEDLEFVERKLLLAVQSKHYSQRDFVKKFANLTPFKDAHGLIRVGGRLVNSSLPFDSRHPILLPKDEYVVKLLVIFLHRKNYHTGPALLLSIVRQNYWIVAARPLVRKVVQECNFCFKFQPHGEYPKMADLPKFRVEECKPFLHTGLDFAGPYNITLSKHRGNKTQKAYLCLYICLATKALHLELVSDLSTEAFLNSFKRFLSRRGPVATLHSDNGTNFIGAKNYLNELYALLNTEKFKMSFGEELTYQKIDWKMVPPSAPHMGGIWERAVRSCKTQIKKIIGEQILTFEELTTVLTQVEALLNSRPLCVLSSSPNDLEALTPAHFLKLTPLSHLPAAPVNENRINRLTRFKLLDQLVQSFWKRWNVEYLSSLQERSKWTNPLVPNLTVGTVVVIKEDNVPPLKWPLGLVEEVYPNQKDNVVRVAKVRVQNNTFKRPVVKLCPLPNQ